MSLLCFGQFSYEDCSYINYGPLLYILYIYAVCGGKIMSTFLPSYYWLSLMIMNVTRPAIGHGQYVTKWLIGKNAQNCWVVDLWISGLLYTINYVKRR